MTLQELSMFVRRVRTAMSALDAQAQADVAAGFAGLLTQQRAVAAFDFDTDTAEMLEGAFS